MGRKEDRRSSRIVADPEEDQAEAGREVGGGKEGTLKGADEALIIGGKGALGARAAVNPPPTGWSGRVKRGPWRFLAAKWFGDRGGRWRRIDRRGRVR